jgi:hypothetical protein
MTTSYVSNELAFELPVARATIADRTIHELVVPGEDASEIALAISRSRLDGRSLARAVEALHDEERRSLGAFQIHGVAARLLGSIEWTDTRMTWKHPSGAVYHRRLHCQIGSLWLSITATAKLADAERADAVAEHVVSTFRPRPQENV